MADTLLPENDAEPDSTIDYLGRPAPVSFKSQPALPTGGPLGKAAAPTTLGGSGGGGPASARRKLATDASAGTLSASDLELAIGLLRKGISTGESISKLVGSNQETRGDTGGQSLSDTVRSNPLDPAELAIVRELQGPVSGGSSVGMEELLTNPQELELLGEAGNLAPGVGSTVGGVAAAGEGVGSEVLNAAGEFAPFVGAGLQASEAIASLAQNPNLTDAEKAELSALNVAGSAVSAFVPWLGPFIGGFPGIENDQGGLIGAVESAFDFKPHIPHEVREGREIGADVNLLNELSKRVSEATTPEEIYQAFAPMNNPNFESDWGPILFGKQHERMGKEKDFERLLETGSPQDINFSWQHGIAGKPAAALNEAMANIVRDQEAVIRAANAGDPTAQASLKQAKARRLARLQAQAQAARNWRAPESIPTGTEGGGGGGGTGGGGGDAP